MSLPSEENKFRTDPMDNLVRMLREKHRFVYTPIFRHEEDAVERQAEALHKKVTEYLTKNICNVYDRLDKEFSLDIDIPSEKDVEPQLTAKKFEGKYKGEFGLKFCLVKYVTGWFSKPVYRVTVVVDLQTDREKQI